MEREWLIGHSGVLLHTLNRFPENCCRTRAGEFVGDAAFEPGTVRSQKQERGRLDLI
jgi:hypothetical protein